MAGCVYCCRQLSDHDRAVRVASVPAHRYQVEVSAMRRDHDEWADRPRFALDADVTVYWPAVRPCWESDR